MALHLLFTSISSWGSDPNDDLESEECFEAPPFNRNLRSEGSSKRSGDGGGSSKRSGNTSKSSGNHTRGNNSGNNNNPGRKVKTIRTESGEVIVVDDGRNGDDLDPNNLDDGMADHLIHHDGVIHDDDGLDPESRAQLKLLKQQLGAGLEGVDLEGLDEEERQQILELKERLENISEDEDEDGLILQDNDKSGAGGAESANPHADHDENVSEASDALPSLFSRVKKKGGGGDVGDGSRLNELINGEEPVESEKLGHSGGGSAYGSGGKVPNKNTGGSLKDQLKATLLSNASKISFGRKDNSKDSSANPNDIDTMIQRIDQENNNQYPIMQRKERVKEMRRKKRRERQLKTASGSVVCPWTGVPKEPFVNYIKSDWYGGDSVVCCGGRCVTGPKYYNAFITLLMSVWPM
jgi:hypothetical protein